MFLSRKAKLLGLTMGLLGAAVAAHADNYTFTPTPMDLNGLDHYYYYSWGVDFKMPANQTITSATLTIHNIWDWTVEDNDHLYITLLNDGTPKGVKQFYDNQEGGDDWAGKGMRIADYSDPVGGHERNYDLVVNFTGAALTRLNQAALSNNIGLGFDPDCHYFNSGVDLKVCTAAVPEPASMATLGLGVAAIIRRKRKKA